MRTLRRSYLVFCLMLVICHGLSAGQSDDVEKPRADRYGDPLPAGAIARLGTGRLAQGYVHHMAFAPNHKILATFGAGGRVGVVCVWDVATGKRIQRWTTARPMGYSPVNAPLTFSPDSRFIALGCPDKVLRVWDAATGKEVLAAAQDYVQAVVFAPNGNSLATLARSGVRVYAFPSGKMVHQLPAAAQTSQLAYSADGKSLIAVGHDQPDRKLFRVHRWDAATGKLQKTHTIEAFSNFAGRLTPDGQTLIVPAARKRIGDPVALRRWDVATAEELAPADGKADYPAQIAVAGDSKTLTAMSQVGRFLIWEARTGKLTRQFDGQIGDLQRTALSGDGKILAAIGRKDQAIHLWNVASGKELHEFTGHRSGPLTVVFAADGRSVLTASHDSSFSHPARTGALWSLRRWDFREGKELMVKALTPPTEIRVVAFAPDGSQVATADNVPGRLRLYRTDTGDETQAWQLPAQKITMHSGKDVKQFDTLATEHLVFAPDGKSIAGASNQKLTLWETASGKPIRELALPPGPVRCRFFPDGHSMLVSQWRTSAVDRVNYALIHLNLRTGATLCSFADINDWAHALDVAPSTHAATAMFRTRVHVYELISQQERWSAEVSPWFATAVFSPDSQRLAAPGRDGVVHVWDALTGRTLGQLKGHDDAVTSLAWSPNGRWLVSAAGNVALVWDIRASINTKLPANAKPLTERELFKHWQTLASPRAADAAAALAALVRSPSVAVPLLSTRLGKAPAGATVEKVAQWVAELGSDAFEDRAAASEELGKLGIAARPALEKALTQLPSTEARRRIEMLLLKIQGPSPAWLQMRRALEALELIGDTGARTALDRLAKNSLDPTIRELALQAHHRLQRRTMPGP